MDSDEVPDDLLQVIQRHIRDVRTLIPLGDGLDNTAWLVNDEIVVRQAKDPDAESIQREAALLAIVGRYAILPVPEIVFVEPEPGVMAYRALPGTPLIDIADRDIPTVAEPLGPFLTAIHRIPLSDVASLVPLDDDPLSTWLDEARSGYEQVANHLPEPARPRIEAFLAQPPPPACQIPAFCHNDFGAEHILINPGTVRVTGIIDWSDAAITDPVRDLALILRDLGPVTLERVLVTYGTILSPVDGQRLMFHARCKLIEDIAYSLETNSPRYLHAALAHLDHTFSGQDPLQRTTCTR